MCTDPLLHCLIVHLTFMQLVAVALPYAWNWRQQQLREEFLSKREVKEKLWVQAQREQEKLAIQVSFKPHLVISWNVVWRASR